MSRVRWIERSLLAVALLAAAFGWRAANDATRRADHLTARVEALAAAQDKLLEATVRARTLPSADLFQPQNGAGMPTPTDAGGFGSFGALGGGGRRGQTGGAAGAAGGPASNMALSPAMRRQARKATQSPGAVLLDSLYEAADQMAVEEQWDAVTYDGVTRVFDDTMMRMNGLYDKAKAGDISMRDARREAMKLRNHAVDDLTDLLGEEGVLSLRDAFAGELEGIRDQWAEGQAP